MVVTGIYPPDSGGPAKFAMKYGTWATERGKEVTVITYSDDRKMVGPPTVPGVISVSRNQPLLIRYVRMLAELGRNVSSSTSVLAVGAFLEVYLSSIIYRFSYVVKVPGDIVWERARNNNITSQGIDEFQHQKLDFKYRIFRNLYSRSLKKARAVIVPSQGLYILCLGWGVQKSKIHLIRNAIEPFEPRRTSPGTFVIDCLTVCRLTPWKGVDELIQYCASRGLRLVVAGDGPDRLRLEELANNLEARVTFCGDIPNDSVKDLLSLTRVFVLNSYYEGLPHALVEARAAGVISVGRIGTGSAEVINDDFDGYLIRPDRPLDETLDLVFATLPESNIFVERAKSDASIRFNSETNFGLITKVLDGIQ
jgi:glycosyltransferase involved in cell wall biosynthesis